MLLISQHVLLQINCCFKNTIISQGILATHLRCVGYLVIVVLQMFSWF